MFDYNQQIRRFFDEKVKLASDMRQMLLDHRDANAKRLIKRLNEARDPISIGESDFQSQGSFAMDTVIQTKFVDEEYDIDYGVVIRRSQLVNQDGNELSAQAVRQLVREALRDDRFKRQPRLMTNCVRVFYADEDSYAHHVDIPVYRTFEDQEGNTVTELAGESDWLASDPKSVNVWLEDVVIQLNAAVDGSGSQLRRMIKLMKRFCRSRRADLDADWDLPNGMKLTMLVVECFVSRDRDDEAFHALLEALQTRLLWNLEIRNLADKATPKALLTKTAADTNVVNLRKRVAEALSELSVLFDSKCDETKARQAWDWVFKSDGFFKHLEDDANAQQNRQDLLVRAALLAAGKGGTDRLGRIVAVSSSVTRNPAHSFFGEDFDLTES